jgi:hypothetical protein
MLFTVDGLEQATRLEIAARHAQRFRGAGIEQVLFDLGCGISADASLPATGSKLSPSFPHTAGPAGTGARWTSLRGEVLECDLVGASGHQTRALGPGNRLAGAVLDAPG